MDNEILAVAFALLDSPDSNSDSDSDCDKIWFEEDTSIIRCKKPKINDYMEVISSYNDSEFKNIFRMNRQTFKFILNIITPELEKMPSGTGRERISPCKQFLIALSMFATSTSYRSVCTQFDIGLSTAWKSVFRVTKALYKLRTVFIKWPSKEKAKDTWMKMEQSYKLPKVIGAIDTSCIKIAPRRKCPEAYFCKSNYNAIHLQVVCDEELRFIDCYAGQPGSMHEMQVFSYSGLQDKCNEEFFPEGSYIIGHSAYSIQKHVIVPYKDNGILTDAEMKFNKKLFSARSIVERSIALLKCRWKCLLEQLPLTRTDLIPRYVIACCVLHNICLLRNDKIDTPVLVNSQCDMTEELEPFLVTEENRNAGILKRLSLT